MRYGAPSRFSFWAYFFSIVPGTFWVGFLLCCHADLILAQLPSGFIRQAVATGLNPTSIVLAPDGRIFITEKNGRILILRDDQLLDDPFLTLEVDDTNERGLGHMVLHPDFNQNGYYYIYYSVPGLRINRISRFTANGDNTIPGSEHIILNLDQAGSDSHNGGDMVFGFDGYLYVSTGDGNENWRGEDLGSTHAKVLRIDEFGQPVLDNPWYTFQYLRANLVYAYGFRNPYTMTQHPLTGDIYANDVGWEKYEEINRIEKGAFYGWPRLEGKRTNEILPSEYQDPVFTYAHANNYCAIVGSVFYLPSVPQFPEQYHGRLFYSDYCTGHIRMLDLDSGADLGVFISDGDRVIDLDVSDAGSLYYLERKGLKDGTAEDNTSTEDGILWKVTYTGSGAPFISRQPQSLLVSVGEDATFIIQASGEIPLTYTWLINGEKLKTADNPTLLMPDVMLDQDSTIIQVEVRNGLGIEMSESVHLYVTTNHRPEPLITSPSEGMRYAAGDTIFYSGLAVDAEDGSLAPANLSFRIDFQHGTHSHPALSWTRDLTQGKWLIPFLGETATDVWYRIHFKATDSEGFSKVVYRDIFPSLGRVHVSSVPSNLIIHLDGAPRATPYEVEGVRGISRYLSLPPKQVFGDSIYFYKNWTDGSEVVNREVKASETDQFFTGTFDGIRSGRGHGLTASYYANSNFEGDPVLITIDSVIDHQYLFKSPLPELPEDYFSISWKGFVQPYRSGIYQFTLFADDGVFLEVDGKVLVFNWEPGVHYEQGSIYMEAGRLYPISLKMYEETQGAQIKLRWSADDFPEEAVPSSQLYPQDFLADPGASGIVYVETLSSGLLQVVIESYKEVQMDFSIITVTGNTFQLPVQWIHVGRNMYSFDVSYLPQGLFFFKGADARSGEQTITPFVKCK